jgi:diguanylate cyclase
VSERFDIMKAQKTNESGEAGKKLRDPRLKIFAWALLFSLWCGWVEFGQPLEDVIQSGRDYIRSHDASNDIVVVALDDKTANELDGLQFPRQIDAEAVDTLFKLGAKRVFFDRVYADPSTPAGDAKFVEILKRYRGRIFLGSMSRTHTSVSKYEEVTPRPEFLKSAAITSLNGKASPFGLSARFPYRSMFNGQHVPSMSAMLSGNVQNTDKLYRPDWSIRIDTIPTISFVDIVKKRITRNQVLGKDFVVGSTTQATGDSHRILSQGWFPGVYFHVAGAETLKAGTPILWEWIPAFLVGLILAIANLFARTKNQRDQTIMAAVIFLGVCPVYLDSRLITADVVPGALLFTIVAYRSMTLRRVQRSSETNIISGLSNLAALRQIGGKRSGTLVALKLRNYSEIAASFDQIVERAVITEIQRRVSVSVDDIEIFHGEGTLMWFTDIPVGEELAHHFEGLKAILGSAVRIGSRDIDISVSFGVDADPARSMPSRIGSATLCAEEAADSNAIWKLYDPDRRHEADWQLSLLSRLDHAVDNGELWVAYQSKLDLKSNRVIGAEALVRWSHPDRGAIGPDDFIAVAEKHNRIERLTAFVLDQAIHDAAMINAKGCDFSIAVNLSVQLLQMPNLLMSIDTVLKKYDFPPQKLTLEITETGRLDRNGSSIAMMRALSAHGIRVSIDDYGTGNATLDYLKILPSNEVKIDRQFIADVNRSDQDRILVASTIEMAHSLGRIVVAEGVETQEVLETLSALGCDIAQGYLIGRPVEFSSIVNTLAPVQRRVAM